MAITPVILVPVDLSENTEILKIHLDTYPFPAGSRFILTHVLPSRIGFDQYEVTKEVSEARNTLSRMSENLRSKTRKCETRLLMGDAADEIVKASLLDDVTSIMVFPHQYEGIRRMLETSVSKKLLYRTHTPIFLDPRDQKAPDRISRLLVPLDGSETGFTILDDFERLFGNNDIEFILFHDEMGVKEDDAGSRNDDTRSRITNWKTRMERAGKKVSIEWTSFKAPAKQIIDRAQDLSVDMIAMTSHAKSPVEKLLEGSVADKVMKAAKCPVLLKSVALDQHVEIEERYLG